MSSKSLLNDDMMDTDEGQRDSIEWLRSDFDAQPVANLDFLMETGNKDVFDDFHNVSPNQRQAQLESREGKAKTPGKGKRKKPSSSSNLLQIGGNNNSDSDIISKPSKKKSNSKSRSTGVKKNASASSMNTNKNSASTATSSSSSNKAAADSKLSNKKVKRLQAHNAAEKRRQQRIAQEIDHIREVLVRQKVMVGSTKRELFQKTVEHINDMFSIIKDYERKEAERASPEDLRIAKMLKDSCTQALYEIDTKFTICHVFGATADITGHTDPLKQLGGNNFLECVHPDDVIRVRSYFRAVFEQKSYGDIDPLEKDATTSNSNSSSSSNTVILSRPTFAPRIPAILYPFQFRRKHATHSYYVPVQINCHALTDKNSNPELFDEGGDKSNLTCKLLFSERSTIMNAVGNVPLSSPSSLLTDKNNDTKNNSNKMLVPQKELLQRRKKLSGINKQGMKHLRRSHTWHNPSDIFETNVMSKKLPKLKQ